MDKEGFIIYKSFYEPIKDFTAEQKGRLLDAIFQYQINETVPTMPAECMIAFKFFRNQFDLDNKKYSKICEKRAAAGRKSAEKRQNEQMSTNANTCQQMPTKATDKDKEKEKEKGKDKDKDKDKDKETEYLNNTINNNNTITDNITKSEKNLNESEVNQFSVDLGSQIIVGRNFTINFQDDFFKDYALADDYLKQSIEEWFVKNKLGKRIDKTFICKQILNFAKKQGKFKDLLGM